MFEFPTEKIPVQSVAVFKVGRHGIKAQLLEIAFCVCVKKFSNFLKAKMSLLPLLQELLDDLRGHPMYDLYDQHFGSGLWNNEILHPTTAFVMSPMRSGYLRPWRNLAVNDSGVSSIHADKNGLQINLDVQQFKPEELKVSVVDGYIVVDGKHEERSDEHGFVSRQFTRRYKIPDNVDEAALAPSLSSDGVLTLKAPPKALPESTSREIPITHTNKPAVKEARQGEGEKMEQ